MPSALDRTLPPCLEVRKVESTLSALGAGWYHWKVDDVAGEIRGALEPYRSSTASEPLPRVLLYTPALTLQQSTREEQDQMIVSLVLVRAPSA